MFEFDPPCRAALPDDADALAELINFAGEGLPLYLWERMTEGDETAWDVGRRRALRAEGGFSYRNAVVSEAGDKVAACLIGYPLAAAPAPVDTAGMPAMFVPLEELESLAPDTWYVNVLATYPALRGQGHGSRLLSVAEQCAAQTGKSGLSIIVSDANEGARRLYTRCGYRYVAERPMVKEDWRNAGKNWMLLTKSLGAR